MRAVTFSAFGGPEVLDIADLPDPRPAPGGVVVRVAASTVNPTDLMMRRGEQAALMTHLEPPYIAGMEFSGTVESVAPGVSIPVGQRVIGVVNPRRPAGGAHAERIAVPAASVTPLADGIDLVDAATVPMNALTALLALDIADLRPGQSLLVTGGAGMLGGSVIRLAHHAGLFVLANARESDAGLLRSFGADRVLPRDAGLEEALRASFPKGVDGLIDGALIGDRAAALVAAGGPAVSLRRSHPITDPRLRTGYVSVLDGFEDAAKIGRIGRLLAEGVLAPRVAEDGRYPCREAREAHRRAEAGGDRGRLVLTFTD
jgi:NADPH:quinone reductase-like Zn-dependent oxidoreductase